MLRKNFLHISVIDCSVIKQPGIFPAGLSSTIICLPSAILLSDITNFVTITWFTYVVHTILFLLLYLFKVCCYIFV